MATAVVTPNHLGRIFYAEPDISSDPWDCGFFAAPKPKSLLRKDVVLHNIRSDGLDKYKLDTHGFEIAKHKSALLNSPEYSIDSFKDDAILTNNYFPEVEHIVKCTTGARKVFVLNCAVRDDAPKDPDEPGKTDGPCGIPIDPDKFDLGQPILPSVAPKVGPARQVHIDYSPDGARQILRNVRATILDEAKDIIEAEDAASLPEEYQGRRYAFYSVWRPLQTVQRDPLTVLDPASFNAKQELVEFVNKQPGVNGAFIAGLHMLKGDNADSHRWCYIPDQENDEVLIIQVFDSYASKEGRPVGTPHGSPEMLDKVYADREGRRSVEVRVAAFW
jgi:hypothetical protein